MRFYTLLLHLYPRSFRAEYGDEMRRMFALRRSAARDRRAVIGLWAESIADIVSNACRVHADVLGQDIRYSVRSLRRSPAFTLTAILVAALGIGATTAAFSVADHVLLRPLPFPRPDRLVKVWQNQAFRGYPRLEYSAANFLDVKSAAGSLDAFGAYMTVSQNLVGEGEPERLEGALVTPDVFKALGVQAARGRVLTSADDRENAPNAIVLSDGLSRARFGANADVLGRRLTLDGDSYTVVGVMPAAFDFPNRRIEFWAPLRMTPGLLEDRTNVALQTVARLRDGVSLDQARGELQVIAARLEQAFPKENAHTGASVHLLRDQVSDQARTLLVTMVAASACMLLIACTNLASLLLARALGRQKELAVRAAVGAGRDRIVRQMFTESLLLAGGGGALGILLAVTVTPLVSQLVPTTLPIPDVPATDVRMLALAGLMTIVTGVGFGVIPALRVTRSVSASGLHEGSRAGSSRSTERMRGGLVIAEVAASIVLLIAAGLLVRALWRVQQIDPGFQAENVLTIGTSLPMPKYAAVAARQQFYDRTVAEIQALPGVTRAAFISFLPMVWRGGIWSVGLDGREPDPVDARVASLRYVTPGFFQSMGIPLKSGRDIADSDREGAANVAVVSQSFADQNWPGQNPLGRQFFIAFRHRTVIGVAGSIRVRGLERESEPQVYIPSGQIDDGWLLFFAPKNLVVSASVPVTTLVGSIRRIVASADAELPLDVRLMSDIVADETAPRRAQVGVLAGFAGVAFLLAGVGIHGLLAFAVSSRTCEIGLRMAMGARTSEIAALVLGRALKLALAGGILGLALGVAAGQTLRAILAGISPLDPAVFTSALALTSLMTLLGCLMPAIRAVRVDPIVTIRSE